MNKTTIAVIVLAALVITVTVVSLNPLRRSEENIKSMLLEVTPIGSKESDVRTIVEQKGWLSPRYSGTTGFRKQETGRASEIVGKTSIRGHLGSYLGFPVPLPTDVTVFWGFDGDSVLIDVWVWKTTDGP
jgi:hypothetical protein